MSVENEAILEKKLIEQLDKQGFKKVTINNEDELNQNFKLQLEKHNKITLSDVEFERILTHLDGGSVFDKAKKLRDKFPLDRDGEVIYIEFFNTKEWCKNLFQVTNQVTMVGTYKNRYDVTLLINGLPLVQIELKRRGIELKEAFNQINRYHKHSFKGLFHYVQIFIISNGVNTKYYANNKLQNFKQTFFWTDKENKKYSNLSEFAEVFLEKCHISKMIAKYIVLNEAEKVLMVLRPYQYFAVESIIDKVENSTQNGYIWHTTGSGKTLTSYKTSQILTESEKIDKVMFVVDRKDLDYQTTKEFNAFSNGSVDGTENTKNLVKQLKNSRSKLIITTIQKLTRAIKHEGHQKQLEAAKDKKIVFIFDECHRSQFGDMHKDIMNFFTNHQSFGFTGTPIFAENANKYRTTKDLFGECLHKYLIKDAINDDNVLGFSVEYLGKYTDKTNLDIDVEAINTKEIIESDDRLNKISEYILNNHARKTYSKEFTGIFAVNSIESLVRYYDILKSKEHNLRIASIFSFGANEEAKDEHSRDSLERIMKDYNKLYDTDYSTDTFDAYYVDVARRVRERQIDLLLVVGMFLTGFDSKTLNTLYVDKNLEYHNLIQAFSRTNRIYNEKKSFGNIVCFRNLKDKTDKAIRLYSDENALDTVLMKSYEEYLEEFNKYIEEMKEIAPDLTAIDEFESEEEKAEFIKRFRNIMRTLTKLNVFTEFKFEDLSIEEQEFEDYKSKYLDIHDSIKNEDKEKVSVLDDIDFELELLRKDNINVAYILALLKELNPSDKGYSKDREFILNTVANSPEMKSKKELIQAFIDKNLPKISDKSMVEDEFESFMNEEKIKAIDEFSQNENLKKEKIVEIVEEYDFSGKFRREILKEALNEKLKFLEKKNRVNYLVGKMKELLEKFSLVNE